MNRFLWDRSTMGCLDSKWWQFAAWQFQRFPGSFCCLSALWDRFAGKKIHQLLPLPKTMVHYVFRVYIHLILRESQHSIKSRFTSFFQRSWNVFVSDCLNTYSGPRRISQRSLTRRRIPRRSDEGCDTRDSERRKALWKETDQVKT